MMAAESAYPEAYIEFLVAFHAQRDYYECHEILEEHWQKQGRTETIWVALIQMAVSLYHQRRKNFSGALKLMRSAYDKLLHEKEHLDELGLDVRQTLNIVQNQINAIEKQQPYCSIALPINDPALLNRCQQLCRQRRLIWGAPSDMANEQLINKHIVIKQQDRA